ALRDPESHMLRPMLADEISSALDDLPEDFRMAVLLVDVQELSYKEAAMALGCPIVTVMSRLHRGRRMLKARLFHQAKALGLVDPELSAPPDVAEGSLPEARSTQNSERSDERPLELDAFRSKKRG